MTKIEKIARVLDQFTEQEIGNRLSEFAMIALKEIILSELKQKEETVKEKKIKE